MSEILNDENIMDELKQKVADLEEEKAVLEAKKSQYDDDISEETKAQMDAVITRVSERIREIQTEILNAPEAPEVPQISSIPSIEEIVPPIKEIVPPMSEILEKDFPPTPAAQPIPPMPPFKSIPPVPPAPVMSEHERKLQDFEKWIAKAEHEIEILEDKKSHLQDSYARVEDKLEEDLNDATRERLEEMMEDLENQIDEIDNNIDELHDKIEELNEEREEFEYGYVDEDIINEFKDLPGVSDKFGKGININFDFSKFDKIAQKFDEKFSKFKNKDKDDEIDVSQETEEINIKLIDEMKERYANISSEEREQRRRYRRESKYNVNFCADAVIDSFCCHQNRPHEEGYIESPDCIIADDPGLKTKWYSEHRHNVEIVHPYWVIIDLGDVKTFNYVRILKASEGGESRHMNMSAWRIEVCRHKLDKENDIWTEFNREINDESSIYEKQFEPQSGRYIRLLIDAPEDDSRNKSGHVRLYGFKIKLRDETGEEIADYTKKAQIDSCCHHNRNERPENLLNDNMKQKWCATRRQVDRVEMPHWVIIDFGESKTFNHLRLVKASESGQDNNWDRGKRHLDMSAWRFEVSDDKENWIEFNRETNDQTSIYTKTFEPVTGRYVRLWVDAPEADPNKKNGRVRIYDLRIEMLGEKSEDKPVTFDDIIAIAPFAKKETLDRLADKLADAEMVNFAKLKEVAPFLSPEAIDKLILKAFEKDDFNAIFALAPHASKTTLEEIALKLDTELEFDKIKALAPFLGKEAITGILISNGKIDMVKLRQLAPLLGSALIDEIVRRMF